MLFFLEKQGELAHRLGKLRTRVPNFPTEDSFANVINVIETGQSDALVSKQKDGKITELSVPLASDNNKQQQQSNLKYMTTGEVDELAAQYNAIGQDLVKLLRYLQLNVTGLRKVHTCLPLCVKLSDNII